MSARPVSMSLRILELIEQRGGMRGMEIQLALAKMSQEEWTKSWEGFDTFRLGKRWWGTNLYSGGVHGHHGLLHVYCKKRKDKKWHRDRRVKVPNGKPWSHRLMKLRAPLRSQYETWKDPHRVR